MPVRMKQLILFLSILLFYPLLFWLTLYYVHDVPIHGTPDPSGGAKVGRAIEAVLGAFFNYCYLFDSMSPMGKKSSYSCWLSMVG